MHIKSKFTTVSLNWQKWPRAAKRCGKDVGGRLGWSGLVLTEQPGDIQCLGFPGAFMQERSKHHLLHDRCDHLLCMPSLQNPSSGPVQGLTQNANPIPIRCVFCLEPMFGNCRPVGIIAIKGLAVCSAIRWPKVFPVSPTYSAPQPQGITYNTPALSFLGSLSFTLTGAFFESEDQFYTNTHSCHFQYSAVHPV